MDKPVVNLGLHAGLGLDFILNELVATAKSGDVIFLSVEYFLSKNGSNDLKENTSKFYPPAKEYYHLNLIEKTEYLLNSNRKVLRSLFENKKASNQKNTSFKIYSRAAFNSMGDVVAHLNKKAYSHLNDKVNMTYSYWDGIDELNEFYEQERRKGIKVYFFFPPYPESEYIRNKEAINKVYNDLKRTLKFPVIATPADFVFPDNYFFDTIYHLNGLGREQRTKKIIDLIRQNKLL